MTSMENLKTPSNKNSFSESFRSWSDLNRRILLEKDAVHARVWYALRYMDKKGKGWLATSQAKNNLREMLGFGERRTYDLLENNGRHWWKTRLDVIMISGQNIIAKRYGFQKLGFAVNIPHCCLSSLSFFKATLFSTWFARDTWRYVDMLLRPNGGKTISLKTLSELFGASRSTIQRWIRLANLKSDAQFQFVKEVSKNTYIPEHVIEQGLSFQAKNEKGESGMAWQLPNRYSTPDLEAHRKKWQNRGLEGPSSRTRATSRRLFFETQKGYEKSDAAIRPGEASYLYSPSWKNGKRWFIQVVS